MQISLVLCLHRIASAMKYLHLVLICAVFMTVHSRPLQWFQRFFKGYKPNNCFNEHGVTLGQFAKFTQLEYNHTQQYKYTNLCILKETTVFSEEGGFDVDRFIDFFTLFEVDQEKVREIVVKCADNNEQKSNPAEWAYRGMKCMRENKFRTLFNDEDVKNKLTELLEELMAKSANDDVETSR